MARDQQERYADKRRSQRHAMAHAVGDFLAAGLRALPAAGLTRSVIHGHCVITRPTEPSLHGICRKLQ